MHMFAFALMGWMLAGALPLAAQESVGMKLEDAGFTMKEANTPQKMARLKSVPARKFVARSKNGRSYYIYADPDYCRCAYIGSEDALKTYRAAASAGVGFLPGYRDPADASKPSGSNLEIEMVHDMASDGDPIPGDDIFHPGF